VAFHHQSNLPLRRLPHVTSSVFIPSCGLVSTLLPDLSPELTLNYKFINKEDYYVYAGVARFE
jgi:hypothetical protein